MEQPGGSMPKNAKDIKLYPNWNTEVSNQSNKQTNKKEGIQVSQIISTKFHRSSVILMQKYLVFIGQVKFEHSDYSES